MDKDNLIAISKKYDNGETEEAKIIMRLLDEIWSLRGALLDIDGVFNEAMPDLCVDCQNIMAEVWPTGVME